MAVIDFPALQELSGYRQPSKVAGWLREHRIRYVIGGDGKPRTTSDLLSEDLDGTKQITTILFE
ncbi:hypothetical protein [uncultured Mediterranean phage uvMED]|nr:hypothetical protein [uncultured Mediterranean phage uvMED]